ncbi:MAG: hypothetical protein KatS3mg085_600 [Candidatus Dojkabacteria bacterium]|nr:MAG: hypothetical protein KatS3mg085_600 [Candidatus Dojkabacteria bacterium]
MRLVLKHYNFVRIFVILIVTIFSVSFNLLTSKQVLASSDITPESVLLEHNKYRTQQNLPPLERNSLLDFSALLKANEMINLNCWSHYCPPNKAPWDFMNEAGYKFVIAGENLAEGFSDVNTLMQAWLNSPTHRDNILRNEYTEIGIAVVYGNFKGKENNPVIVVHFGKPALNSVSANLSQNIKIIQPNNDEVYMQNSVVVRGQAQNIESVDLTLDSKLVNSQNILDGLFFFNLENLESGKHQIIVSDSNNPNLKDSVSFYIDSVFTNPSEVNINQTQEVENNFQLSEVKNSVNIGITLVLISIFMFDFLILKFTNLNTQIDHNIKHSSLHFGILAIVLFILLTANLGGHITDESFII